MKIRASLAVVFAVVFAFAFGTGAGPASKAPKVDPSLRSADFRINRPIGLNDADKTPAPSKPVTPPRASTPRPQVAPTPPKPTTAPVEENLFGLSQNEIIGNASKVGLFAIVSLAPTAVLMLTAFVRINVVLVLLRQALGSPQVPGNQVLNALALLLTALVMRPVGEVVYTNAIEPYAHKTIGWSEAYARASRPVKAFMITQIKRSGHENYVWAIHDETVRPGQPDPVYDDEFSLTVVATAFLLSELTTALVIGFYLYLPFLVIDLVVSAVLAAMGLFMLPPSLVALPLKLILFVLVDGWFRIAIKLLQTFGPIAANP